MTSSSIVWAARGQSAWKSTSLRHQFHAPSLNSCGLFPFHLAEAQLDPIYLLRQARLRYRQKRHFPHLTPLKQTPPIEVSFPDDVLCQSMWLTQMQTRLSPFLAADTKRHGSYHAMLSYCEFDRSSCHCFFSWPLSPGDGHGPCHSGVWSNSQTCRKVGSFDKNWHKLPSNSLTYRAEPKHKMKFAR